MRHLRIPATWPWVHDIVAVFARIAAIPLPAWPPSPPTEEPGEPQPGSASRQMATSARTHWRPYETSRLRWASWWTAKSATSRGDAPWTMSSR